MPSRSPARTYVRTRTHGHVHGCARLVKCRRGDDYPVTRSTRRDPVNLLHSRERDRYENLSTVLKRELLAIHRATTKLQLCICNVYSANTGVVQVYSIVYTLFTLLIHVQPYTVVSQF